VSGVRNRWTKLQCRCEVSKGTECIAGNNTFVSGILSFGVKVFCRAWVFDIISLYHYIIPYLILSFSAGPEFFCRAWVFSGIQDPQLFPAMLEGEEGGHASLTIQLKQCTKKFRPLRLTWYFINSTLFCIYA
jgi:hypothetical protein